MDISIKSLIRRFFRKITITWSLVLLEGIITLLIPLSIGSAVDGLLHNEFNGLYYLTLICLLLLIIGSARRFFDTRAYAKIYTTIGNELVLFEQNRNTALSKISARVHLFDDFIQFLELSMPDIINQFIGLFGTVIIVILISFKVFCICLIAIVFTIIIYSVSTKVIFNLNHNLNNEIEKQIDIIQIGKQEQIKNYFKNVMKWQIKLSDLETLNYSVIWLLLSIVIIYTVITVTKSSNFSFGQIVSVVMYVFSFAESIMTFPLYYQQLIRLNEISNRLTAS